MHIQAVKKFFSQRLLKTLWKGWKTVALTVENSVETVESLSQLPQKTLLSGNVKSCRGIYFTDGKRISVLSKKVVKFPESLVSLTIASNIMEKILLCYTGIFRRKFRKSVRIILRQHTLYPYINRESLCAVHSVKEHALSNLWSHTF